MSSQLLCSHFHLVQDLFVELMATLQMEILATIPIILHMIL